MITVVHGTAQKVWVPVKNSATVYVGSIVAIDRDNYDDGVIVLPLPTGASDTTKKRIPLGVVVGTNNRYPLYSATYKTAYITDAGAASSQTSTTDFVGVEGPWSKGDKTAMVEVELIDPTTILRAPIYNNAVGTAPTLLTATTGSTDGLSATTNAVEHTPVLGMGAIYCRSGANAGIYRITNDTSTTACTWLKAMPYDPAIGDTFIRVPVRTHGPSYVSFGDSTVASYLNSSKTPATNYYAIHVVRLDLSVAGKEFVEFRLDADHFSANRA